ncbi:MAG: NUDIX hydrolase, partial [Bacilli bacterium]
MKLIEKTLNTTTIFDGRIIRLTHDEVLLPNGKVSWREVVHHRGGVCVLAVNEESILLVKQFRSPYQAVLYECPAGKLEDSEHPQLAGKRELEEETGAYAACLLPLGIMYPSLGYTNEVIHLF